MWKLQQKWICKLICIFILFHAWLWLILWKPDFEIIYYYIHLKHTEAQVHTLQINMCMQNTYDHECTWPHRTSVSLHNCCSISILNIIAQVMKIATNLLLDIVPAHQKVTGRLSELNLAKRYLPTFLLFLKTIIHFLLCFP